MDPNAALAELRRLTERQFGEGLLLTDSDVERAFQLFEALDGWLTGGGFLPTPWARGTGRPRKS